MHIVICDDDQAVLNKLEILIYKYLPSNLSAIEITQCHNGEELLSLCRSRSFDIAVLDIEMSGINGVETARVLREYSDKIIIVFLTDYTEYSLQGYEVKAFRYLLKGKEEEYYMQNIKAIFKEHNLKDKSLQISTRDINMDLSVSEISFIEVHLHKVTIHTVDNGTYTCTKSLSAMEAYLKDKHFIKSHKSFLVNLAHIKYIKTNYLLMRSGTTVPISRTYRKGLSMAYIAFHTED